MIDGVSSRLTNSFPHKLDPKNRVAIPSEWRAVEGGSLWLLPLGEEHQHCIKVFTTKKLESIEQTAAQNPNTQEANYFIEWLYSQCVEVTINSQGKLCIPKKMCEQAQLSDLVLLVGKGTFFEIWRPERYALHEQNRQALVSEFGKQIGVL